MQRQPQGGYYSSEEKDIVREKFDLPLIQAIARRKNTRKIRYFGLPGEEARDLVCWGYLCEYVAAVEMSPETFLNLEHSLATQFGDIPSRAYLGDVDRVILRNGSEHPSGGSGPITWTFVSTTVDPDAGEIWDFDVVYLDYFGKLLPYDRGGPKVQSRTRALRDLFTVHRQDAWRRWLLLLTVESRLVGADDRSVMREYLDKIRADSDESTRTVLEFMLDENLYPREQAARLVHATLAHMITTAASNAGVKVEPRPTVLYRGAGTLPMLHFAYEMEPVGMLAPPQHALPLLRAPLVRVRNPYDQPWFELLPNQPPGQTEAYLRAAMNFLDNDQINAILG